ncbi:MAG: CRTAC1 family protein [Gemmataceae bacterium]|nr:CRTAC1 family protein [Gemmataceae bacterium]
MRISSPRFWLPVLLGLAILGAVVLFLAPWGGPGPTPSEAELQPTPGLPWFEDVASRSGITFQHHDSATDMHYIHEVMGSGLAWIDYNNDGWPDLCCVQAGPVHPSTHTGPLPTHRLYRNHGDGTFTDVTDQVGLNHADFGMGCAVGDFDNDGYDDLALTCLGKIALYHNRPDGQGGRRFVEVTARAGGLSNPHWATSCGWGDIDGDGLLDLYVCNYCEIDVANYQPCIHPTTNKRYVCPPAVFRAVKHKLFRNNGDGKFTDVTATSGVGAAPPAPGLGVVLVDLDGDGLLDIYVANDMQPAYLFHNQGGGRFVEKALLAGCALAPNGRFIAGMGVEAGDVDGSGRPSLFVTNFQRDPNMLFLNEGKLFFEEWGFPSGLGPPSVPRLGFGTVFCDVDLDGALDVAVANGHVVRNAQELYGEPYAQQAQLFLGEGRGRFRDVSAQASRYFRQQYVGRGLAWADYNNDGLPDLAFSHNAGPVGLLRNATQTENRWVRLELIGDGEKSNRNAIGARVEIEAGGRKLVRWVCGGGSYLSASERRQLVGLGTADRVEQLTVVWPSGRRQRFAGLDARRWWRLTEGREQPEQVNPSPARP